MMWDVGQEKGSGVKKFEAPAGPYRLLAPDPFSYLA